MAKININKAQARFDKLMDTSIKVGESGDCTVKAVAMLCRVGYRTAHKAMKQQGRKNRQGSSISATIAAIESLGWQVTAVFTKSRQIRHLKEKLGTHGRYLCFTRNHALSYINGHVLDWSAGSKRVVEHIYQVKKIK